LDFISKRYGKLPSEVLRSGSSLDIFVAEIAVGYQNYQQRKQKGQAPDIKNKYSEKELLDMIKRARGEDGDKTD
jgi:hypothetical protein